jgi:hypothetical protein
MSRIMGFLIFISLFSTICLLGNYYILSRLFSFFHLKVNIYFWIAVAVLGIVTGIAESVCNLAGDRMD